MSDAKLFILRNPNTCTKCGVALALNDDGKPFGYAANADIANAGGAMCAKCAGVSEKATSNTEFTATPAISKGKG